MLISPRARLPDFHEMPRPTSFGKDTGLQVRMAFTFFLLGLLYVVFGAVLIAAL
jgi:heat shock protein HtpX